MPAARHWGTGWAVHMALGRRPAGLVLPPLCPGQGWMRAARPTPGTEPLGLLLLWVALCTEANPTVGYMLAQLTQGSRAGSPVPLSGVSEL